MIRTKGEAGTGNVVEAVRHMRTVTDEMRSLSGARPGAADGRGARPGGTGSSWSREVAETGALPVVNFAAGGIATPADAALMMQLGCDGVFVGSGIFKSSDPGPIRPRHRRSHHLPHGSRCPRQGSRGLGEAMPGIEIGTLTETQRLQQRGW